jgi:hypothetical protein
MFTVCNPLLERRLELAAIAQARSLHCGDRGVQQIGRQDHGCHRLDCHGERLALVVEAQPEAAVFEGSGGVGRISCQRIGGRALSQHGAAERIAIPFMQGAAGRLADDADHLGRRRADLEPSGGEALARR